MSKYFTEDTDSSELTNQFQKQETFATPIPQKVEEHIAIQPKETYTQPKEPSTVEEHIAQINDQNIKVNEAMKQISESTASEISNTFETLEPLQLFERMNQITYLLIKTNNRLTAIEEILSGKKEELPNEVTESKLTPREKFEQELNSKKTSIDTATEQLKNGTAASAPGLPTEDYLDKGVNLEKMFPNMPEEAYQASYNAMDKDNDSTKGGVVF